MARAEAEVVQQDNTLLRSWQHHLNQIFISWILGYQVKKKILTWGGKKADFFFRTNTHLKFNFLC